MRRLAGLAMLLVLVAPSGAKAGVTKGRPVKTGETTSFGPGSDGDLQKGLTPMFNDLGNGVVKDQRTGLFWEKKSSDGSIHDFSNLYTWGQDVSPYSMNGTMIGLLATLNTPPCFGGFCDWRIPNVRELASLVNYGALSPATFSAFHTACAPGCTVTTCSCTSSDDYWSSSTLQGFSYYAWHVSFIYGEVGNELKKPSATHCVRAVRGGS